MARFRYTFHVEPRALSSVGRAIRLHRKGRGFKSLSAHLFTKSQIIYLGFCVLQVGDEGPERRKYAEQNSLGEKVCDTFVRL